MTIEAVFPLLLQAFHKWAWHIWKTAGMIESLIMAFCCSCNTSSIHQRQQGSFISSFFVTHCFSYKMEILHKTCFIPYTNKLSCHNIDSICRYIASNRETGSNWKNIWQAETILYSNDFSTETQGTQLWMRCSSNWCQAAPESVIRHKQKLSNSTEGHEDRIHSCKINTVRMLYYAHLLRQGKKL